jgi:hypothetical protein
VLVFTQARISDHKGSDDVNYLIKMKDEAIKYGYSRNCYFHYDTGKCINFDHDWNVRKDGYYLPYNYKKKMSFYDWFKIHIDPCYPNPIVLYPNAIFAVKRERIINKPVEYYQKLIEEVNHHINPSEGHFFERSWFYIFR